VKKGVFFPWETSSGRGAWSQRRGSVKRNAPGKPVIWERLREWNEKKAENEAQDP